MESLSANNIPMEVNISNLQRAVHSALNMHTVVMKLTKRLGHPCLSFEVQKSYLDQSFINQDVPVVVIPYQRLKDMGEPATPEPVCKFFMPKLKILDRVVEKMKEFSADVGLEANQNGDVLFFASSDQTSMKTFFQGLRFDDGKEMDDEMRTKKYTVVVNNKKLMNCLECALLEPKSLVACMVPTHAFILYFSLDDYGSVTYYIPVLA